MKFGISDNSWFKIVDAINKHPEVEKAYIFGSRAMGNYKGGSDVDIALRGKDPNWKIVSGISAELNERLPLPYYFDVIDLNRVEEEAVKDHINEYGIVFIDKGLDKERQYELPKRQSKNKH